MFIKLNVIANASCARIYAWAEGEEAPYQNTRTIRIWHNPETPSIALNFDPPNHCDNDCHLTFRTKMPFKEFCEQFAASEYNDPQNYRYLTHNCANGAHFALKIAGIDLPIKFLKLITLNALCSIKIPGPTLTPIDLYHLARKHKLKEVQNFSMEIFHREKGSLLFWTASEKNARKIKQARTIFSEVAKNMATRPHHMEEYLELLIQTNALLNPMSTVNKKKAYSNFANYFKDREPSPTALAVSQTHNLHALIFGFYLTKYTVEHFENNWQFVVSLFKHVLIVNQDNWRFNLAWAMCIGASFLRVKSILQEELRHPPQPIETPLSLAMSDLARECLDEEEVSKKLCA